MSDYESIRGYFGSPSAKKDHIDAHQLWHN